MALFQKEQTEPCPLGSDFLGPLKSYPLTCLDPLDIADSHKLVREGLSDREGQPTPHLRFTTSSVSQSASTTLFDASGIRGKISAAARQRTSLPAGARPWRACLPPGWEDCGKGEKRAMEGNEQEEKRKEKKREGRWNERKGNGEW